MLGATVGILGPCWADAVRAQALSPTPEAAATDGDQRARLKFEDGRKAYGDGRYRDAWADFHEAYQLSNRPELLYNIGQTADRLGQDADALKAFKMYLQRLPEAQNRHDVENRIRALEERVGASGQPAPQTLGETSTSAAASVSTTSEPAPPPPAAPSKSAGPARSGLYFRAALGLAYLGDSISDNNVDASISGGGTMGNIAVGYAVLPGFVVAGALYHEWAPKPTLSLETRDFDLSSANLWMFGVQADWYINPKTMGWHIEGALSVAWLTLKGEGITSVLERTGPSGIGLVLGGGYEWGIAGDWSFGVLGRLALAGLTSDTTSHGVYSPSILASLSWF